MHPQGGLMGNQQPPPRYPSAQGQWPGQRPGGPRPGPPNGPPQRPMVTIPKALSPPIISVILYTLTKQEKERDK